MDELLAETRAFNAELEQLLATRPPTHEVPVEVTRAAGRDGRSVFPAPVFLPQARDLVVPGRAGPIRVRMLAPERDATGVYLHLHGGGWTLGAADEQDERLWALVEATGLCAATVDYRLAPEHPYPAGPDDCEDAALWLLDRGARELGAPPLFTIGGESAGATLAVVTLVRLRDRHGTEGAFAAANLVYGAYDLTGTPSRRLWGDRNLVLSEPTMEWFRECYLPGRALEERRDPDVSPLYADLRRLPPALFTVGTLDPLLDDSLFMDARWRAAGNESELRVWPEAVHAFNLFPTTAARRSNDDQHAFLRAHASGGRRSG